MGKKRQLLSKHIIYTVYRVFQIKWADKYICLIFPAEHSNFVEIQQIAIITWLRNLQIGVHSMFA